MKKTFLMILSCLLYMGSTAQSTRNITDINNKATNIDSLQGKKVLLIVLPMEKDTGFINQLQRFQKKYEDKVRIIGLVNTQRGSPTKEFYRDAYAAPSQAGIMITEGLQPVDSVANERESVIQWISGKNNNRQQDRYATGSKYFLSEDGRLFAQLGNDVSLDDRIVQSIMNTMVPKAKISPSDSPQPTSAEKLN